VNASPARLLAPLLSIGLFLVWSGVGYAALDALDAGLARGRRLLIAPALGTAVCLVPLFWLNWWGFPVQAVAWPLFLVLVMSAAAILWLRRPAIGSADLRYVVMPIAAALVLNGWPLVTHGFDWLSYSNDDMATYCLQAQRLVEHGLVQPPSPAAIASRADLPANQWLLDLSLTRPGTPLLLAWIASLTRLSVLDVYMPILIAMHLALVAAAGGLVWRDASSRSAALATCWLLAASALTTLGTVTQLLPQVWGLTLACGFLAAAWDLDRPPFGLRRAVVPAFLGASLLVAYTEFAPIIAVPWLVRLLSLRLWQRERRRALATLAAMAICGAIAGAPYIDRYIPFVLRQASIGMSSRGGVDLFPYFRFSSTFANLWGLLPIARMVPEPMMSLAIVAGALAFAATFVALLGPLRRGEPAAVLLLFMLVFSVVLFERGSGFGLFKLAMYVQPFMLGTAALVLAPDAPHARRRGWPALALIAALGLPTQNFYIRSSVDPALVRTVIQDPRTAMADLRALAETRGQRIDVDLPVSPIAKLAGLYLRGNPQRFIGVHDMFRPLADLSVAPRRFVAEASALNEPVRRITGSRRLFSLRDPADPSKADPFTAAPSLAADGESERCDALVTSTAIQSIVNRTTTGDAPGTFRRLACDRARNHLAFVSSPLGRNFYLAGVDPVGIFGLERDYFFPSRTLAGVGRYLLFEVVRPTDSPRLLLDFTSSLKSDGSSALPPVSVVGADRVALPIAGRGSARIVSAPVVPQWIDGHAYLAIDFGVDGTRYPDPRRGLMTWIGGNVALDPRQIVGLARNISLIDDTDYSRTVAPNALALFPQDLANPQLEYSGIYEDGWLSENSVVVLRRPDGPGVLSLRGTLLPDGSQAGMNISILIDGVAAFSERREPGAFTIEVPVPVAERNRVVVGVRFSAVRPLSDGDRRPASAHIDSVTVAPSAAPSASR
jgi:hypothetical protein